MKKLLFVGWMVGLCIPLAGQSFGEWLSDLWEVPPPSRQQLVDQYLTTQKTFPIVEDTLAHFVYSGPLTELALAGDFSGWDPGHENAPMAQVPGTDLWYRTIVFDRAARLEYKMVSNGDSWFADPLNPRIGPGDYSNSELRMPGYVPPPEVIYVDTIPHGGYVEYGVNSRYLKNQRVVGIYYPPGYKETTQAYPLVVVNDGQEYVSAGNMIHVLDNLINEGSIEPVVGVFVPPVDRTAEYAEEKQELYTLFLVEELLPWLESTHRLRTAPTERAIVGSSYGGNISLWVGLKHPDVFGKVGAFSSFVEEDILTGFSAGVPLELKIYLNHGIYDHLDPIHESLEQFLPILEARQYDFLYEEYPEGHNYGFWRAHLDDMLRYLFPASEMDE
jgi:enterochelin esterase-like enzyme